MTNQLYRTAALQKLSLILAALIAAALIASGQQFAAQEPKSRSFKYSLTGEDWLTVRRVNDAKDSDLWHPSFTVITSTYKPVITKHKQADGSIIFEITFRSVGLPSPDLP